MTNNYVVDSNYRTGANCVLYLQKPEFMFYPDTSQSLFPCIVCCQTMVKATKNNLKGIVQHFGNTLICFLAER